MPWTTGITHQHSHDVPGRAAVSSQRQGGRKRKAPVPEGPRPLDLLGCSPATACRQLLYEVLLATAQCPISSLPHRVAICFLLVRLFTQERRKNKLKERKEGRKKTRGGDRLGSQFRSPRTTYTRSSAQQRTWVPHTLLLLGVNLVISSKPTYRRASGLAALGFTCIPEPTVVCSWDWDCDAMHRP